MAVSSWHAEVVDRTDLRNTWLKLYPAIVLRCWPQTRLLLQACDMCTPHRSRVTQGICGRCGLARSHQSTREQTKNVFGMHAGISKQHVLRFSTTQARSKHQSWLPHCACSQQCHCYHAHVAYDTYDIPVLSLPDRARARILLSELAQSLQ